MVARGGCDYAQDGELRPQAGGHVLGCALETARGDSRNSLLRAHGGGCIVRTTEGQHAGAGTPRPGERPAAPTAEAPTVLREARQLAFRFHHRYPPSSERAACTSKPGQLTPLGAFAQSSRGNGGRDHLPLSAWPRRWQTHRLDGRRGGSAPAALPGKMGREREGRSPRG